ncbi:adenine deaminase [Aspergillus cavernicola]|uniref:Adenine deaminase n=1 Tax=Aspergillus cavernicola TaxID=176166 RepID=A0ABR4HJG8_9EURO
MCKSPLHSFLLSLPKCEHHIHLEGALTPQLVFDLASKNNIPLPDLPHYQSPEALAARYAVFNSLDDFLNIHYANMSVLITEDDFYELAWSYFLAAHADGVHHAEVFFDPQSHTSRDIPIASVIKGYKRALDRAEAELCVTSQLIMCFLRHLPVSSAHTTFDSATEFINDGTIHAVGLDSSEVGFRPELFTDVFSKAKEAGLRRTAHGGEEGDVSYITGALDALDAERIDHGIRLIEDPELLKDIAVRGTLLTICPLSNVYLRTTKSVASLPLREFLEAGVQFSLNSDDPAYFGGGILNNYCAVEEAFGFSVDEWRRIAIAGVQGSWIDDTRKRVLLEKIDDMPESDLSPNA